MFKALSKLIVSSTPDNARLDFIVPEYNCGRCGTYPNIFLSDGLVKSLNSWLSTLMLPSLYS